MSKTPKVRFKGFEGEFSTKKLDDLVIFSKGQGFSKSDLQQEGFPIILYGRLYTNYETTISTVNTFVKDNSNAVLSKGYEILIPSSGETAEDIARASVVKEKNVVLGGDLNILSSKSINPVFLAMTLSHSSSNKTIASKAQGKSVVHLHNSDLTDIPVAFPKQEAEQAKIGNFFKEVDSLIAKREQKLDKLQKMKKALLEKMFPQNTTTPQVRFNGFKGEWEEKSFKQVANYKNGKAHENNIVQEGKYVVVNSKFVSTEGNVRKYTDTQIEPLQKNDIAFVLSDVPNGKAIAKTFLVNCNDKYSLNQRVAGIMPLRDVAPYFFHITLNRNRYFLQFDDGAKQTNLSVQDVYGFSSKYPNTTEQTKIGELFKTLDNLISLSKKELEKLKNIKKSLLNKMFV